MRRIINLSINHPYWIVVLIIALTYLAFLSASKIKLDNSFDIWFSENSNTFNDYQSFINKFEDHGFITIFYNTETIFSAQALEFNQKLITRFERVENIKSVFGLSNIVLENSTVEISKNSSLKNYKSKSDRAQNLVRNNPDIFDSFISKDQKSTLIHINVASNNALINYRTMNRVHEVLSEAPFKSTQFYITGTVAIYEQINRLLGKESAKYFVINLFVILLLFVLFYRSIKYAVFGFSIIIISIVTVLGLFSFFGFFANNVTNLLLVVVLLSSIMNMNMVIFKYKRKINQNTNKITAITETLQKLYKPCLISSCVTMLVFLLYIFSQLKPISSFAIFSIVALTIPLLLAFTLLPAFIVIFDAMNKKTLEKKNSYLDFSKWDIATYITGKIKYIIIALFLIVISSVPWMGLETNLLSGLKPINEIAKSIAQANSRFSGIYPIELIITAKNTSNSSRSDIFKKIKLLQLHIEKFNDVDKTYSDNNASTLNDIKLNIYPNIYGHKYWLKNDNTYRITVYTNWLENDSLSKLVFKLESASRKLFSNQNYSVLVTGDIVVRQNLNNNLFDKQIHYLLMSLIAIFLISLISFKKIKLAFVVLVAIIGSTVFSLGTVALLGHSLEVSTLVFFSVTSLVLLNPIIHVIYNLAETGSAEDLNDVITFNNTSSVMIIFCFSILLFSKYLLLVYFSSFVIFSIIAITIIQYFMLNYFKLSN